MGAGASGAKGIDNFRKALQESKIPNTSSITYHGLFYEYYFSTGEIETEKILSTKTMCSITENPVDPKKTEYHVALALKSKFDGEGIVKYGRPPLNLVFVLDISGSMSGGFYSQDKESEQRLSKLDIAKMSLKNLLKHMNDNDNFGLVVFDTEAEVIQELLPWKDIDKDKLNEKISALRPRGGTNMSEGITEAHYLIEQYYSKFKNEEKLSRENRIMFLTDAHPTTGDTSPTGLMGLTEKYSKEQIYVSFFGVGLDFNTDLVEQITNIVGANYFAILSSSDFRRKLDIEFDYIVTPIAFDVDVRVEGANIVNVYGAPGYDGTKKEHDGNIAKILTVMPSHINESQEIKGGTFLLELDDSVNDGLPFKVIMTYKDKFGKEYTEEHSGVFPSLQENQTQFFENLGVRKTVLLVRYVDFIKYLIKCQESNQNQTFSFNDEQKKEIQNFIDFMEKEKEELKDDQLDNEIQCLKDFLK
ncbi:straightjacket isoform c [Anaeramoeba ignava]|uniref:Straightjacket isoform c n=1 Tax=Anaeramoeba ignava TaxID=1746090 RepID=A0A9Q0RHM4_ANAIG|nr:straightjacket isoform c [Anaeramoeba ignava]